MECSEQLILASDGVSLNLVEWSSEGVPMLLLHGYSNEAHIWDDFIPTVSPHYRVLALDLRGHGNSDWHPQAAYAYDDHVADVEAIVESLGIDRLVVVGHSLGGRIAMLYGGARVRKWMDVKTTDLLATTKGDHWGGHSHGNSRNKDVIWLQDRATVLKGR